jgi:hypothetical protein
LRGILIIRKAKIKPFIFIVLFSVIITAAIIIMSKTLPVGILLNPSEQEELRLEVERMYNVRSACLVDGNMMPLRDLFDVTQKYGQWSLEHEVQRVKYLKDWSRQRGIKFTNIASTVRIKKIYNRSKTIRLSLEETYKFDYIYPSDPEPVTNSFGVGIRHTLDLIEKDETYLIYSDWYTDCFEDAIGYYSGTITESSQINDDNTETPILQALTTIKKPYYDRQKAVAYADKYCGAAWGSGNDFKYNKKYMDYNGVGGDCTNFVSQALGDKEGGGLPQDGSWRCDIPKYGRGSGSHAWVNADGLKNYLVYSGKASVIRKGTFKELTSPTSNYPGGFVEKLQLGDLIAFEKNGGIDHFGIVTARDSHGYPLINSHTTDRYHVPWDLGWQGSNVRFILLHVNG